MTDETNELDQLEDEARVTDVQAPDNEAASDEEFDALFSVSLRAALDAAGPSLATEDRIFANLLAARGVVDSPIVAEEPMLDETADAPVVPVATEVGEPVTAEQPVVQAVTEQAVGVEDPIAESVPVNAAQLPAEPIDSSTTVPTPVIQHIDPSTTAPTPVIQAAVEAARDDAAHGEQAPAVDETAPRLHVVRGGIAREASETSDLTDARKPKGSFLSRHISRKFAVTAVAASVAAFALVIGISSLRFGQAPSQDASKVTSETSEETMVSETTGDTDGMDGDAAASATTSKEDAAVSDAAVDTQSDTNANDGGSVSAEHEPTLAEIYTSVLISNGGKLVIVTNENGPEVVDPTALGEFMEAAEATDGTDSVSCEVYHIIAQSGGDSVLYAVRFEADGTFYLAKSV